MSETSTNIGSIVAGFQADASELGQISNQLDKSGGAEGDLHYALRATKNAQDNVISAQKREDLADVREPVDPAEARMLREQAAGLRTQAAGEILRAGDLATGFVRVANLCGDNAKQAGERVRSRMQGSSLAIGVTAVAACMALPGSIGKAQQTAQEGVNTLPNSDSPPSAFEEPMSRFDEAMHDARDAQLIARAAATLTDELAAQIPQ